MASHGKLSGSGDDDVGRMAILLLFACVLALVLINVPIAVALGIVAVAALVAA